MNTKLIKIEDTKQIKNEELAEAAQILRDGGLVAFPTETVYGLGANALDETAAKKIYAAKGRPSDNPLIAHISCLEELKPLVAYIPEAGRKLAEAYWPGPLTMVFPKSDIVPYGTTGGLDTVAVRMPSDPVANRLIKLAGVPVAAPSANTSGRPSPTTAQHVWQDMEGKIEMILDGGPVGIGVESTIVDVSGDVPTLLRPGAITMEMLRETVGRVEIDPAIQAPPSADLRPKAPGMKYRHYAPKAPVTVVTGPAASSARTIQHLAQPGDGVICFDEFATLFDQQVVEHLGPSQDKRIQAQRVFDALRAFDSKDVPQIYAQCPDSQGLGLAISNRLKKAAGFKTIAAEERKVILGITGGTGSGKTSALNAIRDLGGTVIDCDAVYHKMVAENQELRHAIEVKFHGVFNSDGSLNRKKLGELVFENKERMEQLNEVIYRFLVPEVQRLCQEGGDLVAIDAINLVESGADSICDKTIAITAPMELRVRRITARDGIDERYARMRISAQKSDEFYRGKCDYELSNTAETAEAFQSAAQIFFQRLIEELREEKDD